MDKIHMLTERNSAITSGVKAATLVVILGFFAAVADHTLLATRAAADGPVAPVATYVDAQAQAPSLPADVRAREDEVPQHVQAF